MKRRVDKKWKSWSQLQQWRPKDLDEVKVLADKIYLEFATATAAESAKAKQDDYAAHDIYFIRDALLFMEFEQAVSHADAGRVLRVLKYWCFAFRGAGQHNYARECAEILLRWKYETTAAVRTVLERLWFVNRRGKYGGWIAADLYLEHLNYWVKVCSYPDTRKFTDRYYSACIHCHWQRCDCRIHDKERVSTSGGFSGHQPPSRQLLRRP